VLLAADGLAGPQIAQRVGCTEPSVIKWRRQYAEDGVAGLADAPRPGGPKTVLTEAPAPGVPAVPEEARRGHVLAGEEPTRPAAFVPTGCSWLNLVECFFSVITRQAIRRGSFASVRQLTDTIGAFIDHWNDHPPRSRGPRTPRRP
jgi:hypothetical protein